MAFEDGKYKAGGFQVPASTGNFSVTGLGFEIGCQGVLFFGLNTDATMDTIIYDLPAAVFCGLMGQPEGTGPIEAQVNCQLMQPFNQQSKGSIPIYCLADWHIVDYEASPVSLDADGFTVNFTTIPASGTRWVHYLAWGDWDNADASRSLLGSTQTLNLGWKAGAALVAGCISSGPTDIPAANPGDWNRPDLNGFLVGWWGGATYHGTDTNAWKSGFLSVGGPSPGSSYHTRNFSDTPLTVITFGWTPHALGFSEDIHQAYPTGVDLFDYYEETNGIWASDVFAYWSGDGTCGEATPNSTIAAGPKTVHISSVTGIDAILFYGSCGHQGGVGSEFNDVGWMFGVVTPDYQCCVAMDNPTGYVYQSVTKSWVSAITPGPGINAGTTQFQDGAATFTYTTTDDSQGAVPLQTITYLAFGHPNKFAPRIYRRIPVLRP